MQTTIRFSNPIDTLPILSTANFFSYKRRIISYYILSRYTAIMLRFHGNNYTIFFFFFRKMVIQNGE